MKEELIELFKTTRKLTTEWFEADNLDKIRLTYRNGNVVVENEYGNFFEVSDLSEKEMEVLFYNISYYKQYYLEDLEVLYYTKKDNKVNVYYIEDKTLKPLFNCDNNGNEDLYKLANENDYYINDSELIHI